MPLCGKLEELISDALCAASNRPTRAAAADETVDDHIAQVGRVTVGSDAP